MAKNLKEHIRNVYGKEIELSKQKQECPACGHYAFHLYGENLDKAKCFHPSCELHLNLNVINGDVDCKCIVAERFKAASHEFLFTKGQDDQPIQLYIYANKMRKASDIVLRRSDVGAVPLDYDVKKENEDLINELEQKINEESDAKKKEKLQNKLNDLLEFIVKLQKFINDNYNRFVFFYRDENELITLFKTRKPYIDTKTFQIVKVQSKVGVFNAHLFAPHEMTSKKHKKVAERMVIFEGEFDQLTFATWCINNAFPIQSCALGGANGDIKTALNLSEKPCLFYDNDEAGMIVLEKAKEFRSIRAVTTPKPYKDIDEFINSFEDDKDCKDAVIDLLSNAEFHHRELSGIRKQVRAMMKFKELPVLDRNQAVADIVKNELCSVGSSLKTIIICISSLMIIDV